MIYFTSCSTSTRCRSSSRLQLRHLYLCPQSPPSGASVNVLARFGRHFCEGLCNEIDIRERSQFVASGQLLWRSEIYPRATCMTYAFHPIVGCLPSTHLSYDDRGTRCKRMEYARIVYPKEDIVHVQRESRKDKDAGGHDALYEHVSDDFETHRGRADYSDEQVGRSIVVQFIFKQRDFCVEEDRVRSGEFCERDAVCGVVWVGVCPVGWFVRVMSGIGRRVCPVVWLGRDSGGQRQARTRVCASETRSERRTCRRHGSHRLLNQASA